MVNWTNVLGLLLRVSVNITFQSTTMLAFMFAQKAGINQGLITSLFSTYCVFTSFIFFFLFSEKLKTKFLVGIGLMLNCVILVSISQSQNKKSSEVKPITVENEIEFEFIRISNKHIDGFQDLPMVSMAFLGTDNISKEKAGFMAISLGIFTPFMISIFISISRYWSQVHGYKSIDFTVDAFLCMGLIEIVFFIQHQMNVGYTVKAMLCGVGASFA